MIDRCVLISTEDVFDVRVSESEGEREKPILSSLLCSSHIPVRLFVHSTIDTYSRHERMRLTFISNDDEKERMKTKSLLLLALFETLRAEQRTSGQCLVR